MLFNIDKQVVVTYNEKFKGDVYEVSVVTQDIEKDNDRVESILIRSPLIRHMDLGYRFIYDSSRMNTLGKNPTYINFYNTLELEYGCIIAKTIDEIMGGGDKGSIWVQCELNNFFSKKLKDDTLENPIVWDQGHIKDWIRRFSIDGGSYDLLFTGAGHDVLKIINAYNSSDICVIEKTIIRDDIGISPIGESL